MINMLLYQTLAFTYKNNKFKISAPLWNGEF